MDVATNFLTPGRARVSHTAGDYSRQSDKICRLGRLSPHSEDQNRARTWMAAICDRRPILKVSRKPYSGLNRAAFLLLALSATPTLSFSHDGDLIEAVMANDRDRVEFESSNPLSVNRVGESGRTALMVAAAYGYVDVARVLIAKGADVNASGHIGNTALIYAVQEGNTAIVQILIEAGAEVDVKNKFGTNPGALAVGYGYRDVLEILGEARTEEREESKVFAGLVGN